MSMLPLKRATIVAVNGRPAKDLLECREDDCNTPAPRFTSPTTSAIAGATMRVDFAGPDSPCPPLHPRGSWSTIAPPHPDRLRHDPHRRVRDPAWGSGPTSPLRASTGGMAGGSALFSAADYLKRLRPAACESVAIRAAADELLVRHAGGDNAFGSSPLIAAAGADQGGLAGIDSGRGLVDWGRQLAVCYGAAASAFRSCFTNALHKKSLRADSTA